MKKSLFLLIFLSLISCNYENYESIEDATEDTTIIQAAYIENNRLYILTIDDSSIKGFFISYFQHNEPRFGPNFSKVKSSYWSNGEVIQPNQGWTVKIEIVFKDLYYETEL
jgi:hypothetical protein